MKKTAFITLNTLLLSLLSSSLMAAGDPVAGREKARVCAGCHGPAGKSMAPIYPILAGQHSEYLENALRAYRSQLRKGGNAQLMYPMAAGLSDQDIADLAAYFSSQH